MGLILAAEKITKNYMSRQVLDNANLYLEREKIYVIKGKSGSGKSTLLNILSGIEKPDSGRITFLNKDFHHLNDQQQSSIRGLHFGYVFQNYNLIPEFTVEQNIVLAKTINKLPLDKKRVIELAEELNIVSLLDKKVSFLSGGEQQRVAIARALIKSPQIIFADEPTGNLDQANTEIVINLFEKLVRDYKVTLVVVTHEKSLFNVPHQEFHLINGQLKEVQRHA